MEKDSYFQEALSRFVHETACGGAIRHLADIGYTVGQIKEALDFPASYSQVQMEVWSYLVEKGVILLEEPGKSIPGRKARFVREYDQFGKATFRQIVEEPRQTEKVECFREHLVESREAVVLLQAMREENGEENCYGSCDFGLMPGIGRMSGGKSVEKNWLEVLEERQREYISGLPWERKRVYHRLDGRMTAILLALYQAGLYQGEWYFLRSRDKVALRPVILHNAE